MKKSIIIISILSILLIAGCIEKQEPNTMNYYGETLHFRADLKEAEKIPVYPSEDIIKSILFDPHIEKITIAFIPEDGVNGFYGVTGFELAYKITLAERVNLGEVIPIETLQINSIDDINATRENPVILMMGPGDSNRTAVTVAGYLIMLEAKDFSEIDRKYTDLDLAADKLLLVLLK